MNHVLEAAARQVTLGWVLGVTTVLFVGGFSFWVWWAYSGRNKARWEADRRLPFMDGGDS
jgi:cbb3-type cytochrome oxidase subunit 3